MLVHILFLHIDPLRVSTCFPMLRDTLCLVFYFAILTEGGLGLLMLRDWMDFFWDNVILPFRSRWRDRRKLIAIVLLHSFRNSVTVFGTDSGEIYLRTQNTIKLSLEHFPIFSWVGCLCGYLLLDKGYRRWYNTQGSTLRQNKITNRNLQIYR